MNDARLQKVPRTQLGIENQSRVFKVFNDDDTKLTVRDVHKSLPDLNERTIRRAIDALVSGGFLIPHGKLDNAVLYAKRSTSMTDENAGLIPFAGDLVSVESFMQIVSNLESDPFKVKLSALSPETVLALRRQMLFSVLSAGEPGHNEQLKNVIKNLNVFKKEIEHALSIIDGLLASPIWYDQYRDQIGYQVRQVQKNDPELFKTVVAVVSGG